MLKGKWVAVWGSAPSEPAAVPAVYAKDITLRFNFRSPLNGKAVRLHFNNLYGKEDAVLTRVFLLKKGVPAVPATFDKSESLSLKAGAQAVSDEIPFELKRRDEYSVTVYLGGMTPLQSGTKDTGPLSDFYFAEGDFASEEVLPSFHSMKIDNAYFLDTVDMFTEEARAAAVVCFGDSITAQSWPDYLGVRVLRDDNSRLAVIRRGKCRAEHSPRETVRRVRDHPGVAPVPFLHRFSLLPVGALPAVFPERKARRVLHGSSAVFSNDAAGRRIVLLAVRPAP